MFKRTVCDMLWKRVVDSETDEAKCIIQITREES